MQESHQDSIETCGILFTAFQLVQVFLPLLFIGMTHRNLLSPSHCGSCSPESEHFQQSLPWPSSSGHSPHYSIPSNPPPSRGLPGAQVQPFLSGARLLAGSCVIHPVCRCLHFVFLGLCKSLRSAEPKTTPRFCDSFGGLRTQHRVLPVGEVYFSERVGKMCKQREARRLG